MKHILLMLGFLSSASVFSMSKEIEIVNIQQSNSFYNMSIDVLHCIISHLDQQQLSCFVLVNKIAHKAVLESKLYNYRQWSDLQLSLRGMSLINDLFLELLALSINRCENRWSPKDDVRFNTICELFKNSPFSKESIVLRFVEYLSYDTAIFGELRRLGCALPDLSFFLKEEGFDNEKSLYLFQTYLRGEDPNIQGLMEDPLYKKVKGTLGNFIRAQERLHPIRQKIKQGELRLLKKRCPLDIVIDTALTTEEVRYMILNDPGLTRHCMKDILVTSFRNHKMGIFQLDEPCLIILTKFVINYDMSQDLAFNRNLLNFYKQNASAKTYAKLLHYCLRSRQETLTGLYSCAYEDDQRPYHREAMELYKDLGELDKVEFHTNEIQILNEKFKKLRLVNDQSSKLRENLIFNASRLKKYKF